jgi:RHS repeat-associated protein
VDEIVASAPGGGPWLYHQYDARGHCIMLTNTSGGIQEQYEYDAFGQPYIYDANGSLVARDLGSPAGNRFLFTGREWLKELRVYDYRNRLYQPELGRFVQPDPKEFDAGDYNLYRYCHNDPVNHSDPTGLYGMGTGWTDDQWKTFNAAQQAAASRLEKASVKMDAKVFEKVFGKGSATAENMAKVQHTMQGMAAALRDDGTKGYIANARPEPGSSVMGRGSEPGKTVWINTAHNLFGKIGAQSWNVGHESGHNMGLHHGTGDNAAYKYGNDAQKATYQNQSPADRLRNPDNYMDFAR